MTESQPVDARMSKIERILTDDLRLSRASSLQEFLMGSSASYLVRPDLRAAKHFDFRPDVVIHDQQLAALGLMYLVNSTQTPDNQVEKFIDDCTFLRHLLLADKNLGDALPYSVELVMVAEFTHVREISKVFRRIVRQSDLLEAIGVNILWPHPETGEFDKKNIRSAFAWLLRHTRVWYEEHAQKGSGEVRKPTRLTLDNYRLSGERTIELKNKTRVNIIHGYNGSGKTSLAEAVELAVTGSIERLSRIRGLDYSAVLRHKRSPSPARITIGYDRETEPYEVKSHGLDSPLARTLNSASLRLDHTVMDRLSRGTDAERAEILLGAYFPEDVRTYIEFHKARQMAEEALGRLPLDLRVHLKLNDSQPLQDRLNEAVMLVDAASDQPIVAQVLDRWLPVSLPDLKVLSAISSGLNPILGKIESGTLIPEQLSELLEELDLEFEPLASTLGEKLAVLRRAKGALGRLNGWVIAEQSGAGDDPVRVLNSWLELCALTDLVEKQLQIALVLKDVEQTPASPALSIELASGLFGQPPIEPAKVAALQARLELWTRLRDDYFSQMESLRGGTRPVAAPASAPRPQLSATDIRSLNEVSPWLSSAREESLEEPLGQAVMRALGENKYRRLGSITIGQADWEQPIISWLSALEKTLEGVHNRNSQGDRRLTGMERLARIRDLIAQAAAFRDLQERVEKTFIRRIGGEIQAALSEITTLFTPARWAYDEVKFEHRSGTAGSEIVLETDNERAEMRLNTAELNIFVLALFLLGSVRVENPLFLLVLDDPFQNMDEMTMTCVARGLAKVGRLLPEPWQILILVHGEDALARLTREIPATIHRLPWLTPDQEGLQDLPKIESKLGRREQVQDLGSVLKRGPRTREKFASGLT